MPARIAIALHGPNDNTLGQELLRNAGANLDQEKIPPTRSVLDTQPVQLPTQIGQPLAIVVLGAADVLGIVKRGQRSHLGERIYIKGLTDAVEGINHFR